MEYAFGLVAEQDRVTVKSNAYFLRIGLAGMRRMRVHLRCGYASFQGVAHITQVGTKEQIGFERLQVTPGRLAARECAADDGQGVMRRRLHDAQAAHRVVAREDDHFVQIKQEQVLAKQ